MEACLGDMLSAQCAALRGGLPETAVTERVVARHLHGSRQLRAHKHSDNPPQFSPFQRLKAVRVAGRERKALPAMGAALPGALRQGLLLVFLLCVDRHFRKFSMWDLKISVSLC